MKDSEFLELLNLYLDHEISAADAARLEAEVQNNEERRRVYNEYCRMQKACTLLAKDFAEQPTARKVVDFEPRRSAWGPGLFAVGGLAVAAACVAFVLLKPTPVLAPNSAVIPQSVAVVAPAPAAQAVVIPAAVAPNPVLQLANNAGPAVSSGNARPMLTAMPLKLAGANATNAEALIAAAQQNGQAQFEWMRNVQLVPIQQLPVNELRLDARSPLQPASRTYSGGRPVQGTVEMTAFKFQR